jgi:hypothetical protein
MKHKMNDYQQSIIGKAVAAYKKDGHCFLH